MPLRWQALESITKYQLLIFLESLSWKNVNMNRRPYFDYLGKETLDIAFKNISKINEKNISKERPKPKCVCNCSENRSCKNFCRDHWHIFVDDCSFKYCKIAESLLPIHYILIMYWKIYELYIRMYTYVCAAYDTLFSKF